MTENYLIGKNMKRIREAANMTQNEVAKELCVERSVYSKYETGKHSLPKEHLHTFSTLFHVDEAMLQKNMSMVLPDTSSLLKNVSLLTLLLEDFQEIVIPDTVIHELMFQKKRTYPKCSHSSKTAWIVMRNVLLYLEQYPSRISVKSSQHFSGNNDQKIATLAKNLEKTQNGDVIIIHDDLDFSFLYPNNLLLKEYIAQRTSHCDYNTLMEINDAFHSDWTVFDKPISTDLLQCYLPDGNTLLISCIHCNEKSVVAKRGYKIASDVKLKKLQFLLQHGANINQTDNSKHHLTPLAHCVQIRDFPSFRFLLDENVDFNKGSINETSANYLRQGNEGNTPLMIACWHGNLTFVKELCQQKGISLNQQDRNGYTALIKCGVQKQKCIKKGTSYKDFQKVYQYLLSLPKIDPLIRDRYNKTAEDWWHDTE